MSGKQRHSCIVFVFYLKKDRDVGTHATATQLLTWRNGCLQDVVHSVMGVVLLKSTKKFSLNGGNEWSLQYSGDVDRLCGCCDL